ncbi:MAG: ATP-binding cassette domain-containing protein [Anaerolineae bacterium]
MAQESLLVVEDLYLVREGQTILRGVNLEVPRGVIFALLGRNGSGKSSLAYVLMGCAGYTPSRGRILFNGEDVTNLSITERARRGITLAWQEPAHFEGLKVKDYLALGMENPSRERMEQALEAVALSPLAYLDRTVNETLSGGERKRIELAAVYAMRPKLAILDEPDSGIDVLSLDDIGALIRRLRDEGTTVLLITHRDEMVPVADRAALMCGGEVLRVGEPAEVRRHYARRCRPCEVAEPVEAPGGGYERL